MRETGKRGLARLLVKLLHRRSPWEVRTAKLRAIQKTIDQGLWTTEKRCEILKKLVTIYQERDKLINLEHDLFELCGFTGYRASRMSVRNADGTWVKNHEFYGDTEMVEK